MKNKLKFTTPKQTVLAFLKMWLEEAKSPVPNIGVQRFGLCLALWTNIDHMTLRQQNQVATWLDRRLQKDFFQNWNYPFGGRKAYLNDSMKFCAHKNKARLAWVRKVLAENS